MGSIIRSDGRCKKEIIKQICQAKVAFNKKINLGASSAQFGNSWYRIYASIFYIKNKFLISKRAIDTMTKSNNGIRAKMFKVMPTNNYYIGLDTLGRERVGHRSQSCKTP